MSMTANSKRQAVVDAVKSREGKNTYTQGTKRTQVASGYGDCSSTMQWAYKQIGINIGDHTESQLTSKTAKDVALTIKDGVPDESKMLPGDLLYFRGGSKVHADRTKHVGHVEMYVGNGEISGHASGTGPTRKNLKDYCRRKQAQHSAYAKPANCGLICVRRVVDGTAASGAVKEKPAASSGSAIVKGSVVQFSGTRQCKSSDGGAEYVSAPCLAEVTAVKEGTAYPYHLVGINVHGWVSAAYVAVLQTGTIICDSLHIRQNPDKTSVSLGIMKKGDTITITGDAVNGWYPVIWKDKTGYAKKNDSFIRVA